MGAAGRIGIFLLVWVGIPIGLGVAGYYVVGPRLSQSAVVKPYLPSSTQSKNKPSAPKIEANPSVPNVTVPGGDKSAKFDEPEVELSVTKIRRRSHSTRTQKPKPPVKPEEKPAEPAPSEKPDQGAGDGAPTPGADGLRP